MFALAVALASVFLSLSHSLSPSLSLSSSHCAAPFLAAFIFIAAKLRHGRVALKHLDAIFAISRQPRPESPHCAQDEAASDRGGAEIMAGLCTNHVVVVAVVVVVLLFVLFCVAMALVSERLSVPAKIMYAGPGINQQRSAANEA